jgi:hypothetical protein
MSSQARSTKDAPSNEFGVNEVHVIGKEQREEFERLSTDLRSELDPQGALENLTFKHLLYAAWNLHLLREEEVHAFAAFNLKHLDCLNRYATRHQRNYHQALEELRKLQTERAFRVATLPKPVRNAVPRLVDVPALSKRTRREAPELVLAMYNNLLKEAGLPDRAPVAA